MCNETRNGKLKTPLYRMFSNKFVCSILCFALELLPYSNLYSQYIMGITVIIKICQFNPL